MKMRNTTIVLVLGGLMAAWPVWAGDLADEIARQMRLQGFANIGIEETWLGRTRITGTRNGGSREIIVNPNTGEILRDLWLNSEGKVRAADIDFDDAAEDAQDAAGDAKDAAKDAADDKSDDSGKGAGSGSGSGSGGNSGSGRDGDSADD